MKEADRILVDIFFCRKSSEEVNKWRVAFRVYLSDPVSGKNFDILELGEVEERSYDTLASETEQLPEGGELGLEFLIPFPFRMDKERQRTHITVQTFPSKKGFQGSLEKRLPVNVRMTGFSFCHITGTIRRSGILRIPSRATCSTSTAAPGCSISKVC